MTVPWKGTKPLSLLPRAAGKALRRLRQESARETGTVSHGLVGGLGGESFPTMGLSLGEEC